MNRRMCKREYKISPLGKKIGNNICNKMYDLGVDSIYLARSSGISIIQIRRYIAGTSVPSVEALISICRALDCDYADIIGVI